MIALSSKKMVEERAGRLPGGREIQAGLDRRLCGMAAAKRMIGTRLAIHVRRMVDISRGQTPPDPNQCVLILGPSGAGKTALVETAAAVLRLPFVAVNAAGLTQEGYRGNNITDDFRALLEKARGRASVARFGLILFDEWDKRIQRVNEPDGFAVGIQSEMLRIMEGTDIKLPPVPGAREASPVTLSTFGMMFVFAGAFEGLWRHGAVRDGNPPAIGFRPAPAATSRCLGDLRLRDALKAYGMLPEFLNRLTGILTLPPPTIDDILNLMAFENGPVRQCNRRLRGFGAELKPLETSARRIAEYACESRTYCRGVRLVLQKAMDHCITNDMKGDILLEPSDIDCFLDDREPEVRHGVEPAAPLLKCEDEVPRG